MDCEEIEAGQALAQKKGKELERWNRNTDYALDYAVWGKALDVGPKDYMNRDSKEVAYSQIDLLMSDKYHVSREDYKSKWESVYHCTHA